MSSASAFASPGFAAFVQHHVLGREQRALPVGVHGAAFERDGRREAAGAGHRDDPAGHPGRLGVVVMEAAVGGVAPLNGAQRAVPVEEEGRRRVARPGVVGRHAHDLDGAGRAGGLPAAAMARLLDVAWGGDHAHRLVAREAARDQRDLVARRLHVEEAVLTARPRHPAAGVRRPFGRHGEACLGWGLAHASSVAGLRCARETI